MLRPSLNFQHGIVGDFIHMHGNLSSNLQEAGGSQHNIKFLFRQREKFFVSHFCELLSQFIARCCRCWWCSLTMKSFLLLKLISIRVQLSRGTTDDDELSRATNKVQICMNNGSCPGLKLRYILSLDLETGRKLAQQLKWKRKVSIIFFGWRDFCHSEKK